MFKFGARREVAALKAELEWAHKRIEQLQTQGTQWQARALGYYRSLMAANKGCQRLRRALNRQLERTVCLCGNLMGSDLCKKMHADSRKNRQEVGPK